MAKTKGKAKIAASNVASKMEATCGNDVNAESAASESVEINEAATTVTLDKSEEVEKKEEIRDGADSEEVEKSEEIEDDLDESEKEQEIEENKDGLEQEEVEEVEGAEESEDGLDASEDVNKIEETVNSFEKSNKGDDVDEAKEDGKVEPVETDVPEVEKEERDMIREVKDKEAANGENASDKKVKRIRKRKKKTAVSAAASNDANKSGEANKQGTSAEAKNDLQIPGKRAEGETKEDGIIEAVGTDVPRGEKVEDGGNGEVKDNGKGESVPNKKAKRMRVRKRKAADGAAASNDANKPSEADKQGTSAAAKDSKMVDGMGLIFMCNAKTKKDCFRYKVFGLPESKKELVAKVYKGMRLFLFDIDLKLMYGIYKAASPGGYNIEPKAFKSAFPSQVRFTVLKDCLPLPEEKFKAAIKGNYYGRNKFNCQLSTEQVKNLCKLFQTAAQPSKKKRSGEAIISEQERSFSSRNRKRARHEREVIRGEQELSPLSRGRKRSRHEREVVRSERERVSSPRSRKRSHRERARHEDSIPRGRDVYARREAYASPPPRALALPPLPPVPYAYVQPADDYYYRREPPLHDLRDSRIVHVETRNHEPLEYRDPYSLYREPLSRETGYREPLPREPLYREAVYGEPLPREAVYREPLSRDALFNIPLSREAVYREPVHTVAVNPASLTPAAYDRPTTHYRY